MITICRSPHWRDERECFCVVMCSASIPLLLSVDTMPKLAVKYDKASGIASLSYKRSYSLLGWCDPNIAESIITHHLRGRSVRRRKRLLNGVSINCRVDPRCDSPSTVRPTSPILK